MGVVRYCDFTKKSIGDGDPVFKLTIDNRTFEVSAEGKDLLIGVLEDRASVTPTRIIDTTPIISSPPPMNQPYRYQLEAEVAGDGFEDGQDAFEKGQAQASITPPSLPPDNPLEIILPSDTRKPLAPPTKATQERVLREAKKFEPGTLPALNPGKANKEARQKLLERESRQIDALRQIAGSQINVSENYKNIPGYHNGE